MIKKKEHFIEKYIKILSDDNDIKTHIKDIFKWYGELFKKIKF